MALYNEVVVFDQATKLAYVCVWLHLDQHPSPQHAYLSGKQRLAAITARLSAVPSLVNAKVRPPFCCQKALTCSSRSRFRQSCCSFYTI